MELVRSIEMIL